MSTHNLCFQAKVRKIMYTPVNPSFTIQACFRDELCVFVPVRYDILNF